MRSNKSPRCGRRSRRDRPGDRGDPRGRVFSRTTDHPWPGGFRHRKIADGLRGTTATNAPSSAAAGGLPAGKWQTTAAGKAELAEVKAGEWNFAQLFVDDGAAVTGRACPSKATTRSPASSSRRPKRKAKAATSSSSSGDEIRSDWANAGDVEVIPFHEWAISRMHIAAVYPEEHRVVFTGQTRGLSRWAAFQQGLPLLRRERPRGPRRAGAVVSRPARRHANLRPSAGRRRGEGRRHCAAAGPASGAQGRRRLGRWAQHIQFRGLTFAHTNWVLPPAGQAFPAGGNRPGFGDCRPGGTEHRLRSLRRASHGRLRDGLRRRLPRQPRRELRAGRSGRRRRQDRPRQRRPWTTSVACRPRRARNWSPTTPSAIA